MMFSASEALKASIKGFYDTHYESILSTVRAHAAQGKHSCRYEFREPMRFHPEIFSPLISSLKTQEFKVKIRYKFFSRTNVKGIILSWE